MTIDRRRFLRLAAGSLGALGMGAIAGCSSTCPDTGRPTPEETVAITDSPAGPFDEPPGGSWPTLRGRASRNAYATGPLPDGAPSVRWRTGLDLPGTDRGGLSASAPTVGSGLVLVADSRRVHALSLSTGDRRWRSPTLDLPSLDTFDEWEANTPSPAIGPDGTVFAGTAGGVAALARDDGSVRWSVDGMSDVTSPAVVDGTVYAQGAGDVVAVDTTGDERWRRTVTRGEPAYAPAIGTSAVVIAEDEGIRGLDPETGEDVWTTDHRPETHPVVEGETCFIGTFEGLHALDARTGDEQWTFSRGEAHALLSPVVTPDTIYAVEQPGEAGAASFALDRTDGAPEARWCSSIGSGAVTAATDDLALGSLSIWEGPDAAKGIVAFSKALGDSRWAIEGGSRPRDWLTPPAVLDDAVVVTTRGGTAVALGGGT